MSKKEKLVNLPGQPLRLHELNIESLAQLLYDKKIRFTDGKRIGEMFDEEGESYYVGLHPGQLAVINSPARFKVLGAGRRFGKTKVCVLLALAAVLQPGRKIWIVGPEYTHVEKVFVELYSILVNQLGWIKKNANDGTAARKSRGDYLIQLHNGSVIEGKSASNKDSMAGDALDLIIFDEAALEGNLDGIWFQMLRPTLTDKKGSAIFISSPRGKNDFYKLFKLGQLGKLQREGIVAITKNAEGQNNDMRDWDSWTMPTYTNPFIPREEYESAKKESLMKGTYTTFKQEYDADFESVSDAAFPEFKVYKTLRAETEEKRIPYHVQDYKFNPAYGMWVAACDFNVSRPASTVYLQVDKNRNVIIFDELFRPNTNAYIQAQFIAEKSKELGIPYAGVIGDISGSFANPSGINSFDQVKAVLGHEPVGRRQGRETGNHLLHQWLATPELDKYGNLIKDENGQPKTYPKLFIASHCIETIHALETAKKKLGKNGSIKEDYEEFVSGHEGLLDAIRYALCYLFHVQEPVRVIKGIT